MQKLIANWLQTSIDKWNRFATCILFAEEKPQEPFMFRQCGKRLSIKESGSSRRNPPNLGGSKCSSFRFNAHLTRKIVPKISWKNMLLVVTLRQFTIFAFIIVCYVFRLSKGHSEKHSKRQKPKKLACPYHQKDFHVSLTAACRTFAKKRSENFRSNSKAESTGTFVYSRKSIPDPNYLCESYSYPLDMCDVSLVEFVVILVVDPYFLTWTKTSKFPQCTTWIIGEGSENNNWRWFRSTNPSAWPHRLTASSRLPVSSCLFVLLSLKSRSWWWESEMRNFIFTVIISINI